MAATSPARSSVPVRSFGRFQLLQLLGKSARTMTWLAADQGGGRELLLAMPRAQAADASALEHWRQQARRASRADHPALGRVVELGDVERWPYVAYERGEAVTLAELRGAKAMPAADVVPWAMAVLQGLAFAHEAGVVHGDLQAVSVLLGKGGPRLIGLGVAYAEPGESEGAAGLHARREAAEHDVLTFGLLLHLVLAGTPALDQPDLALAMRCMPPWGRDIVRLPWSAGQPIADPLRAIVNRATDRQTRQRYRNARTFAGALEGWWRADGEQGGGPLSLLADRLRSVGLLPSIPGGAARAARLALMERERTIELAEIVLQDVALTFELLRLVNSAQVRGTLAAGSGPVLTIRRAISLVGLDGVRRAALPLRAWPGPLDDVQAAALQSTMDAARLAGRIAQHLRPAGYDAEVVYLIALLQNLGRLVVQYHLADEMLQIRRLMQPAPPDKPGEPDGPGMTEEAASFAVMGIDIEAMGQAVGRQWGLDNSVLAMMRRPPAGRPVRGGEDDAEILRLSAGCANEVVDALVAPPERSAALLRRVALRYGRTLHLTPRDIELAVHDARSGERRAPLADGVAA